MAPAAQGSGIPASVLPAFGGAAVAGAAWEEVWIQAVASHGSFSREVISCYLGERSQTKLPRGVSRT